MGKNTERSGDKLPVDHKAISGDRRGKALVICTRKDRSGWEREHQQACKVLSQNLGLQVTILLERQHNKL